MAETIRSLFDAALAQHQHGRIEEAAADYRRILQDEPAHAEALHMLGVIRLQQSEPAEAAELIGRALRINPAASAAHNNLGNALLALGRAAEAVAHYEQALAVHPAFVEAHFNLARALQALDRHEAAAASYARAVALRPNFAEAHNNLGNALQALGRFEEAAAALRQAIAMAPHLAQAHNNLGVVLQALQRHAEAIGHHERSLALQPGNAEALNNLGNALRALDRHQEALSRFRAALAIRPDYAEALYNRGIALQALKREREAIAPYEAALALRPDYVEAHNNLGNVFLELGQLEAAGAHYDKALALKPDFPEALANRGTVLRGLGRIDEARAAFARAARLAPRTTRTYLDLVDCRRMLPDDPHLAVMEALAGDASLDDEARIFLGFALGKAYEDLGRHADSFRALAAANAGKRRTMDYDEAATTGELQRIAAAFTPALLARGRGRGGGQPSPIFIVGMPRSGSTLVARILASHPAVHDGGELIELPQAVAALCDGGAGFPAAVGALSEGDLGRFADSYLGPVRALAPRARRIVDKMPSNFRFVGLIRLALPGAHIIHTRRNPVDTCISCFSKLFTAGQPFAYDLGELGRYYRAYAALMAHWRRILPAEAMLEVDYEAVVADLEGMARRIVAHCGLDWHPACLAFHKTAGVVRTASAAQVREPLYGSSVGRSGPYGALLRPLLDALGPESR